MKKVAIILSLILWSLNLIHAQESVSIKPELFLIKDSDNYLLVTYVRTEEITKGEVTTILVSKEQVILDTIKGMVLNPKTLEKILRTNYETLKTESVQIDSANYVYSWQKFWLKYKVEKSFILSKKNQTIHYDCLKKTGPGQLNVEYLLTLIFVILFLHLNVIKSKLLLQNEYSFILTSFFLIFLFSGANQDFFSIISSGWSGFMMLGLTYLVLGYVFSDFNKPIIIVVYTLAPLLITRLWEFGLMTISLSLIGWIIMEIKHSRTSKIKKVK